MISTLVAKILELKSQAFFVYFYFTECIIAYDQFRDMLYFLANKVADFYDFS